MPPRYVSWLLMVLVLPAVSLIGGQTQSPPATAQTAVSPDLSWMPKAETGALRFLADHPQADGRGVVVAIFDTGVDPGAIGLQTTPDGRPKVIDLIDGTGSGDVDMQRVVKAQDHKIQGLSGRELTLGQDWQNPTQEYRVGLKSGYELFPSELVSEIQSEREKAFRKEQAEHRARLQRELQEWNRAHPKPDETQEVEQKELQARLDLLDELLKDYSDPGPVYDCVVFHDGTHFRAIIDTDQDGDLSDEKLLTNFRVERQYGTFPDPINLNFGVNVYQSGEVLSIVADTGAHGTHVAGIVAAYFPDQPEWNGVAPGAQIVSVKIGDTRLDGMESGPGLVRGLKAVLENKCDLINMSYGEPTTTPGIGRIAELYAELVNEQDVIFVSSAGNAGPALTSVGAPGGTTSALIGVGAYVSPEMMRSEYSLRGKLPGLPYTWTSRGPTADGDLGVDIFAPGGAIAPVPLWTRQASQQMNGTSMASPNACGNIALLLSAAKQQQLSYTPHSVRKAIQNTAQELPHADVFGAGPGLIQVDKAWDYLSRNADSYFEKLSYEVRVPNLGNGRGIYLRERHQTVSPTNFRVQVNASLKEHASIQERLDVSVALNLKATADWVITGDLLHLTHGGNRFDVEVNPGQLEPGVHYAEVLATDRSRPDAGPLFRVPITVVIPLNDVEGFDPLNSLRRRGTFEPGIVQRLFVQPPAGAAWCEMKMNLVDTSDVKFFRLHTLQLVDGTRFSFAESDMYYPLTPGVETVHSFPIVPGRMLEIDLAQYWSILGDSQLEYEIKFHGGRPDDVQITLATGEGTKRVTLLNELAAEPISPKGALNTWRRTLSPKKSNVSALWQDRDELPNGSSVYELTLDYEMKLESDGDVTLRWLPLENLLYDAPIGPFIYHIHDKNGRRVTTNDMFPDSISLEPGTYQVRLAMHHHMPDVLKRFEKLPLTVDQELKAPIPLKFWNSPADAASNRSGRVGGLLKTGGATTFYVGESAFGGLPKTLIPGDRLLGTLTYSENETADTLFTVEYVFAASKTVTGETAASAEPLPLDKQLRELKLKHLKTLDPLGDDFAKLFEELRAAEATDRKPLITRLHLLDSDKDRKTRLSRIIEAGRELIASYDQDQLAAKLGKRAPATDEEATKAREQAEAEQKELIDALYRVARAIGYRELPDVVANEPIADQADQDRQFKEAVAALETWVDLDEAPYSLLKIRQLRREKHPAQAIQALNKLLNDEAPLMHFKKRRDLFTELNWPAWADWQQQQMLLKFPRELPPYK